MSYRIQHIRSLDVIAYRYHVLFCDIWGVLHDGRHVFPEAISALEKARKKGLAVLLLTNAPNPYTSVIAQLNALGIPQTAYDCIVTSGDTTRILIKNSEKKIFHIGSPFDCVLYNDLDVEIVSEIQANTVVCTGLFHSENALQEDYMKILHRLHARGLPFICANPDTAVRQGKHLIPCAGVLAHKYQNLGGKILMAGKPYKPIYDRAQKKIEEILKREIHKNQILCIGDGMLTDIRGAVENGFDSVYVLQGIHSHEYTDSGYIHNPNLDAFLSAHAPYQPKVLIDKLQ